MSEHVTAEFLREYAAEELDAYALPDEAEVVRRAAATIEALQAQLAERAPASADTRELRILAEILDANGHVDGQFLRDVAGELDARRAECERLRDLLSAAREWVNDHSEYNTDDGYRCIDCDSLTATERCDIDCAYTLLTTRIDAALGDGQ